MSEPPKLPLTPAQHAHWQRCYPDLVKLKLAFEKERNRNVRQMIERIASDAALK